MAHLFIISAPSGAGKSTLCRYLRQQFPDIGYSISHTTRPPRPGEVDGREYHFIDESRFKAGIESGRWAEWAVVHGNYYGTSAALLNQALAAGQDLLLDIDVQGAVQIMARFPGAVSIFILPPSLESLRERMEKRGQDRPEVIEKRVENAKAEMAQRDRYQHVIVNDDLEAAQSELRRLIEGYQDHGA